MKSVARIRRRDVGAAGTWPAGVPNLLQRVYEARGASSMEQAQPRLAQLLPPDLLGGMDAATALLADAIVAAARASLELDFDKAEQPWQQGLFQADILDPLVRHRARRAAEHAGFQPDVLRADGVGRA